MRRILRIAVALLAAALAGYLAFWPVVIDPVAWDAPADQGLVGPFAPNRRLAATERIPLGDHEGPEDIAGGPDGRLYTGTSDGTVLSFDPTGADIRVIAVTGGRPLGLEFDANGNLLVANAYIGLQRVRPDGTVETLADSVNGKPILYTDDVAVATDGNVYFSDASTKFGVRGAGGSYEASLLDLMEHGGHGRILAWNPATRRARVLVDGLNFANGVALSDDQTFLLIAETGAYRILRHWLAGSRQGETEVLIDNLPGFPDNVNTGRNGRYWVGLVAPRSGLLDALSGWPSLRKAVQRLPAWLRPGAVPSSHVFAIDRDGNVLEDLQDPDAGLPALTGAYESRDALWLTTLFGGFAGRLDEPQFADR